MTGSIRASDITSPSRVPLPIKEVLELYGELGIAAWSGGKPVKSWVAFCTIVSGLLRAWDPEAPGYREVFRKTGHILNWFASISMQGKPPTRTANGSEYMAPAPGMFSERNPRLAELSTPLHRPVLVQLLGQMAVGINRLRAARRHFALAAELAREEGLLWLKSMMQIDRATAAAGCGLVYEALDAALEAIRGLATSNVLLERGEDLLSSTIDPLEVWATLPEESRGQAESELFWMVIAPLVLGALVARRDGDVVENWVRQFTNCKRILLNARYWEEVLEASRLVLSPAPREGTIQKINALPEDDVAMRLMLYLALSQATGSVLSEGLRAHSVILGVLLDRGRAASIVSGEFVSYLVGYWRQVANERAFQLRSPRQFKARMDELWGKSDAGAACRVLLWAEEAVGESLPSRIRQKFLGQIASLKDPVA